MTNTYNTGNALGSTDPRDLLDNASNLDDAMNSGLPTFVDRLGVTRDTYSGQENQFNTAQTGRDTQFTTAQNDREAEFQQFLTDSGFTSLGNYAPGLNFTAYHQYTARDGFFYRPKPSSVPFTTTGTWVGGDENLFNLFSTDDVLRQDLANGTDPAKGSALLAFRLDAIGAVGTTAADMHSKAPDAVLNFGADNTGATNATAAIKAFFDAGILSGVGGDIPAGDYLITRGQLVFDTPFIDKIWPNFTTAGHKAVRFLDADGTDAPFITITNGAATSGSGKYWLGGGLGGITFDANGHAKTANQHGLSLRGMFGTKFGWMRGNDIGGSPLHFPTALFGGNNPDPYAMTFCEFEASEANRVGGRAFDNQNYLGLNLCRIKHVRAIETQLGGIFGIGAGNSFDLLSMGSCRGWAIDDGTQVDAAGGAPSRVRVGIAELDNPQYGIRLNRTTDFRYEQIRFVHRYNSGHTDNVYWPIIAFDMANGASGNTSLVNGFAQHRLEAGGTLGVLGDIIKGNGAGAFTAYDMDNRIFDNGALGFTDADLFTNIGTLDYGVIRRDNKPVMDNRVKVAALVRSSTAATVPNSGWAAAGAKIPFNDFELYDRGSYYDSANSWFLVPYSGLYRVDGQIALAVAAGTRVRVGFAVDVAGVVTVVKARTDYATSAAVQHYEVGGTVSLTAGQRVFFMADQNTAGAVALSAPNSSTADLTWSIEAV